MCLLTKLLVVSILTTGIYARAQYIDDRVKKYEEQVRAHPQSAEAWYKLGEADLLSFGKTKARTAFEKAIELKPDYAEHIMVWASGTKIQVAVVISLFLKNSMRRQ